MRWTLVEKIQRTSTSPALSTVVSERAVGSDVNVLLLAVLDEVILRKERVRLDLVCSLRHCEDIKRAI